ncbi:DUF3450 domain-containing protein [Vibrio sp. S4M6]|uniref:DUF3450 domain-containing protein n=1 Tax=Vibrio sinus TaxID=2946865 RepID=UPI00202A7699|nr:DUF3450 domain-containing protein [Vibrio sinus]MCL9781270.1 DUF3450 domain-containing protein [Vibrio sinus]
MRLFKIGMVITTACIFSSAYASELSSAQAIQNQTNTQSAKSQVKVDASADESIKLRAEIEQLKQQVKNLTIYRDHMAAMIKSQDQEMSSIQSQIGEINKTRQGVVPLMYQMIDGLKQIVATSEPIQLQQREARVAKLQALMSQADVSDAEKYRQIIEAYQIELDYGNKLQQYQSQITLKSGQKVEAQVLHLGRISMIARNPDHSQYWIWDDSTKSWTQADSSLDSNLNQAYQVATKQSTPSLLTLPVSLNVAQGEKK